MRNRPSTIATVADATAFLSAIGFEVIDTAGGWIIRDADEFELTIDTGEEFIDYARYERDVRRMVGASFITHGTTPRDVKGGTS
jgi:hypothetical protein